MALQQLSAPSRASSRVPAGTPRSGVDHVKVKHADRYTVIGNHLLQHHSLSLTAIGLAGYIQSLPAGARIGIKRLTERFPEGEGRISGALRELEEYGYLERSRVRLASGRVVTRTVSYNHPSAKCGSAPRPGPARAVEPTPGPGPGLGPGTEPDPDPEPASEPDPEPVSGPEPGPGALSVPVPEPEPEPDPDPESEGEPDQDQEQEQGQGQGGDPDPDPEPVPEPVLGPDAGPVSELGPVSEPGAAPGPVPPPEAAALLARLRGDDPRLLLADRDVRRLAPLVAQWFQRGADPVAVRVMLSSELPGDLRHSAGLLEHRLKAWIPPHLPAAAPVRPAGRPDPMQNCDGCDRAFRAPEPGGRCRDCPPAA
ncbi:procyclic acidic repetitive family protein [Streptomyces sp. AP-93]|uniref:procyclic acidic repetitive family protein n=1 Tax=Streptomyces sp. AP-93 TaxID=2929048 RepID=UPI001FB019A6|nr:procyclic acidic repetitive family protein [Streptomyces sp. AP-93]MCJ0874118.1 procyclic acidic repetitive family protein [Streptomyces sp. AP-93]